MVYFRNDTITIKYDEELQLVRTQWHGYAGSEEYREILTMYLQLVREKPVTRWIGDNTKAKAIRPVDQEWTTKEWAPKFSQEGNVKKLAVIVSKDIFNKMAVENMIMKAEGVIGFDTQYFSNEEQAYAWAMEKEVEA
ncbi:STAS/SEC14 domain-containing protein [Rufibacter soli]